MNAFRKISSVTLFISIMLTMACKTDELIFEGPYFVRFTEAALTEKESHSAVIKIQVHNGGPAPKGDVTINYFVSGSAREGIDYTIKGTRGKVKIKSGEYFGNIEIQLINNSNNILRSQDVILTLQTIENNSGLYVGEGVSQIGKIYTLTIQDDCILGGDYYGLRSSGDVPTEDIKITSSDCENYTLSNWDVGVFTFPSVRPLQFIDNGDNTLTIPPQEDPTLGDEDNTIDGFGTVDPTTRIIRLTVRLVDDEAQPSFTFNLIPD